MASLQIPLPTPKELEVLQVLWEHEPCSARRVTEILSQRRPRNAAWVVKTLNAMTEKGMLMRRRHNGAALYKARIDRERTNGGLVKDLLQRAFCGSSVSLIAHALNQAQPSMQELDEIHHAVRHFRNGLRGG